MKKATDYYAIKTLALIAFGIGGVFILIELIARALTQKNTIIGILIGIVAILFAPLVNSVTGLFDDSVSADKNSFWQNYKSVLISLIFSLLFIILILPFIAIYLGAVLGAMGIVICIVGFIIYFLQNILGLDIGAAKDIGIETLGLVFLGIIIYEVLFVAGYYIYQRNSEKVWNWIRKIFSR